jgi:Domain of unknown function (DUF4386)
VTRRVNATIAGVTFLVYIAAGITALALKNRVNVAAVLTLITSFSALVLGVTLYAITRDEDPDLALLALLCRVIESIPGHGGGAIYFAVGSTLFCWLLLRGRMIPVGLAWLGVIASALLVVLLLLRTAGLFGPGANWSSSLTWLTWLPMLVFELTFAVWLIVKGVDVPARRRAV